MEHLRRFYPYNSFKLKLCISFSCTFFQI
jgi:hypothetical protein